jgi:serine/threonine protein kinase/tetratricopeptide (TPR) repeat protein
MEEKIRRNELMVGKTILHYKVLEELGEGGMGQVYLAEDAKLDRKVALKFLPSHLTVDKEARERFEREAKAAAALNHPNIITIYEISEFEDSTTAGRQTFIAMEYVDGISLREKITDSPLPNEDIIDITTQICQGLSKAHQAGIVHRDIKPENILIDTDGRVKILDFGIAKLKGAGKLTKETSTLGTVNYMSPEQARGEDVDFRTDIWSLGVVLYEMITGQLPFKGEYEQAVIYSIINEEPENLEKVRPNIPKTIPNILAKMLNKNVGQRFQNVDELLIDLKTIQKNEIAESSLSVVKRKVATKKLTYFAISFLLILFVYFSINKFFIPKDKESIDVSLKDIPSIAVMYFEDATIDKNKSLSRLLPHMLITSLQQSPNINVFGYQKLYDILQEIGKGEVKSIDMNTATEIARKVDAQIMLTGIVSKRENVYRVDYQLQNVPTGKMISASKVISSDTYQLADEMATRVLDKIATSKPSNKLPKIAEITTSNIEAYRYYVRGKDFRNKCQWKDAWENYSKAIGLDSTFAIAYLEMWGFARLVGFTQKYTDSFLNKAVEFADQTSEREKLIILTQDNFYRGKTRNFHLTCEKLIQKYPSYHQGYQYLADYHFDRREWNKCIHYLKKRVEIEGYTLNELDVLIHLLFVQGQEDSACYYISKLIEHFPNDPLAWVSETFNLHLRKGDFEKAFSESRRAVVIKPEESWSHRILGYVYFLSSQFDSAEVEFNLVGSLGWKSCSARLVSANRIFQGKESSGIIFLEDIKHSNDQETISFVNTLERIFYDLQGNKIQAREIWKNTREDFYDLTSSHRKEGDSYLADSLLNYAIPEAYYGGNFDGALMLCDQLRKEIVQKDLGREYSLDYSAWRANVLYVNNRFSEAAAEYEKLVNEDPMTFYYFRLAKCLYQLKKYKEAKDMLLKVNKFEVLTLHWLTIEFAYTYPRTFFLLGRVNEELGEYEQAANAYEKLLDIWKEADENLSELIYAKIRLAKLQKGENQ